MTAADALARLAALPDLELLPDSRLAGYAVDGLLPAVVLRPRSPAAVADAMALFAGEGTPVLPWGGGTAISAGNPLAAPCAVLDLSSLDRVVEYQPRDRTITVEAGITMAALARVVAEHGQLLPLDPPLPQRATVGGTLASGLSGPRRFRYGTARDLLIGTTAVLADGARVHAGGRVAKNVAGYDLNKLWAGSAGTLAVITQASFRLWPAPPVTELLALEFATVEQAHAAAMEVAGSTLQPLALDLAGPGALELAAAQSPSSWLLCMENGGTPATVERVRGELRAIASQCRAAHMALLGGSEAEPVRSALRDFGYPERAGALLLRAAVLPARGGAAAAALARLPGEPRLLARAGNGVLLAWWPAAGPEFAPASIDAARAAIGALGGVVTIQQAPATVRAAHDAWGLPATDTALMARVKDAYDPDHRLSPGRSPAPR